MCQVTQSLKNCAVFLILRGIGSDFHLQKIIVSWLGRKIHRTSRGKKISTQICGLIKIFSVDKVYKVHGPNLIAK